MPFKGTNLRAWDKAKKGRTPEERKKIYYKEKAKDDKRKNPQSFDNNFGSFGAGFGIPKAPKYPQAHPPPIAKKAIPRTPVRKVEKPFVIKSSITESPLSEISLKEFRFFCNTSIRSSVQTTSFIGRMIRLFSFSLPVPCITGLNFLIVSTVLKSKSTLYASSSL